MSKTIISKKVMGGGGSKAHKKAMAMTRLLTEKLPEELAVKKKQLESKQSDVEKAKTNSGN